VGDKMITSGWDLKKNHFDWTSDFVIFFFFQENKIK
jgi:hypothetical protein